MWRKILDLIVIILGTIALFLIAIFSWAQDIPTEIIERIRGQSALEVASVRMQKDGLETLWLSVLFYPPDILLMAYVHLTPRGYAFGDADVQEILRIKGEETILLWKRPPAAK